MDKIKLFCFPYAGGSSTIYNKWNPFLDDRIILEPIELPGRGLKIKEDLIASLEELIDYIMIRIRSDIFSGDLYALFGHSMGALIVHQLLEKFLEEKIPMPIHAFFSGREAPHIERKTKNYHLMDDEAFIDSVKKMGGTPPGFFEHPELVNVFLPVLKNDFQIADTEAYNRNYLKRSLNVTALFGKEERFCETEREGWKDYTSGICSIKYFEGDHFFINNRYKEITRLINNQLLPLNTNHSY